MSIHHLKIKRQPFEDLVSGRKTGEVRNCADREFREGDQVELFLIDETGNPANKSIVRTITHIQRGYGLPDDICVLSYAAPVVERQPVAFVLTRDDEVCYEADDGIVISNTPGDETNLYKWKPVYFDTSPPAPVAVVMPSIQDDGVEGRGYNKALIDCAYAIEAAAVPFVNDPRFKNESI